MLYVVMVMISPVQLHTWMRRCCCSLSCSSCCCKSCRVLCNLQLCISQSNAAPLITAKADLLRVTVCRAVESHWSCRHTWTHTDRQTESVFHPEDSTCLSGQRDSPQQQPGVSHPDSSSVQSEREDDGRQQHLPALLTVAVMRAPPAGAHRN